jgi:hypothetical protein
VVIGDSPINERTTSGEQQSPGSALAVRVTLVQSLNPGPALEYWIKEYTPPFLLGFWDEMQPIGFAFGSRLYKLQTMVPKTSVVQPTSGVVLHNVSGANEYYSSTYTKMHEVLVLHWSLNPLVFTSRHKQLPNEVDKALFVRVLEVCDTFFKPQSFF